MDQPDPPLFQMIESRGADGRACLALHGELDLTVAGTLNDNLWRLAGAERRLRINLSGLTFVDSAGISVLVVASRSAPREGWDLEIDQTVTPSVRLALEISGVDGLLWPPAIP
jgi:anti-sigma B factor antagonist